jgi:outer membrane protein assembly factor BamB
MSYEPARRGVRRAWIPISAVILCGAVAGGIWYYPDPEFRADLKSMISSSAVMLAILIIVTWLLFLSGLRWFARIGILAIAVAAVAGMISDVEFQGYLLPVFHFRWEHFERGPREKARQTAIPTAAPEDFPEYRNRNRDGVVIGPALDTGWAIDQPERLWQLGCGGGYGGISVVGPSAVTLEQIGPDEAVVCYDTDNGHERWRYDHKAEFREKMGGEGPRTNPTIVDGDIYTLGATGHLARLDGKTGQPKWTAEILDGRNNIYWGMSGSPLVYDRFVVVAPGRNPPGINKEPGAGEGPAVVAYDRDTGKVAWQAGERQAGYSSPQLAAVAGVRQVLLFDGEGLGSFDPENGNALWFHPWEQDPPVNVAQPLVFEDGRVFISSGYGHGSAMLKLTLKDGKWQSEELWTTSKLKSKFSSPVRRGEYIYGIDESAGSLACVDAKNGRLKWKDGRYGNGQVLVMGDHILVESETGRLVLVDANPEQWHEVATFQALEGRKNWNYLTVARGRAYVRNHHVMACYKLPTRKD